jgi:hypothetical protein
MYARIESAPSTGRVQLDPRLVGGGLAAALAIGVIAGFAAATLNIHAPSTVASHAPAATVNAPSTGVYGDRDSRLPIATVPAGSLNDRNVGRNLVPNSVMSELDRANAARAITSPGNSLCDRNSCGTLVTGSNVSALDRAMAARVAALQGMAGVDWNAAAGDGYGVRDSRPPLAPFKLR